MLSRMLAVAFLAFSSISHAAPSPKSTPASVFPLKDGFPNPNPKQLRAIEVRARGTLPNGGAPNNISSDGITNLQFIAFNEIFEVAFFSQLLKNITNNVSGFEAPARWSRSYLLETVDTILAQEELHALFANGALKANKKQPIQPCRWNFPVSNLNEAVNFILGQTDSVLGTLQNVIQIFAENGEAALSAGISAAVGNEAEQNGFYRVFQGKVPSELPFLTASSRSLAFSYIKSFTVPGSCPNINTVNLTTIPPLNLLNQPKPHKPSTLQFSFKPKGTLPKQASIAYINGQNTPIVVPIKSATKKNQKIFIEASFPYLKNLLNGATFAVVVKGKGPFADATAVANAGLYGPAIILNN